jgi:hypothetical protein
LLFITNFQLRTTHAIDNCFSYFKQVAHNFICKKPFVFNMYMQYHLSYSWRANYIYDMQLHVIEMTLFCIVIHVYGFGQLFHDTWQVKNILILNLFNLFNLNHNIGCQHMTFRCKDVDIWYLSRLGRFMPYGQTFFIFSSICH